MFEISIISIIRMVGDRHPQHQKEGDFNYFNLGGPKIIEIIEIPAILTWRSSPTPPPPIEIIEMGPISIISMISIRGGPK